MPVQPTYPGVYIEEVPSGVRTITGVSTSVTAFIGYTTRGPANLATQIFNFSDFERTFGGLHRESILSYSVFQYFQNGGREAWIVRVADGTTAASVTLLNDPDSASTDRQPVLEITAASEGQWGNQLRLDADYDTRNPNSLFNISIIETTLEDGTVRMIRSERFNNLSMNAHAVRYAVDAINADSKLIRAQRTDSALSLLDDSDISKRGQSVSGVLDPIPELTFDDHAKLAITINDEGPYEFYILERDERLSSGDLVEIADRITRAVQTLSPSHRAFSGFTCTPNGNQLVAIAGDTADAERSEVRFTDASSQNAARILKLGIQNGGRETAAAAAMRPRTNRHG